MHSIRCFSSSGRIMTYKTALISTRTAEYDSFKRGLAQKHNSVLMPSQTNVTELEIGYEYTSMYIYVYI